MHVVCPNCDSTYEVADELEGKSLKCSDCSTLFRARLNRAAIKEHSLNKSVEKPWPTKAPTLNPTKPRQFGTGFMITVAVIVCGLLFAALVASLTFVYIANSPRNVEERQGDEVQTPVFEPDSRTQQY